MKNFQNQAKIIKVSSALRIIAFAGLILWGIVILGVLVASVATILAASQGFIFKDCLAVFLPIPMLVFLFIANLKLFRFFDRLKKSFLFDSKTVGNLSAAGKWLLTLWLYEIVSHNNITMTCWWWHDYNLKLSAPDPGSLLAALTLIFVAWLLKEAQKIQEEQELTV